ADQRSTAQLVRDHVDAAFPDNPKYWGGAPFITTYIYDVALADMKRLIPWAVVVIVVIVVASFRDPFGAFLALLSTGLGILVAHGLMGATGYDSNIVLSAMPVILFAVGSAYGVHVMVRYYALRAHHECAEALSLTMKQIAPSVLVATLTTVAGLLSLLTMDIQPLREFGVFSAAGILINMVLALTFVPAVVGLAELKARRFGRSMYASACIAFIGFVRKHRIPMLVLLGIVMVGGAAFTRRVEARMESEAFFSPDSPPAQAERFFSKEFGGSQFIQLHIDGDMTDPAVLREVQGLADRIRVLPHVSSATHVAQVLAIVNEAMVGERRVPPTQAQVRVLYRFLAGREALRQLVTDDQQQALLQIKVDTDAHEPTMALLDSVEKLAAESLPGRYRIVGQPPPEKTDEAPTKKAPAPDPAHVARLRQLVVERIEAIFLEFDLKPPDAQMLGERLKSMAQPEPDEDVVAARVTTYLKSDESVLEEELHDKAEAIAQVAASMAPEPPEDVLLSAMVSILKAPLPPECTEKKAEGEEAPSGEASEEATGEATGEAGEPAAKDPCGQARAENARRAELAEDVELALATPLKEIWRQERSRGFAAQMLGKLQITLPQDEGARTRLINVVGDAILDLERPTGLAATDSGDKTLTKTVSGVPVLYRTLTRSVTSNQLYSLAMSVGLVLLLMILRFRSLATGLLAATPTAVALLLVYGIMGAIDLQLDIGTSMLASIIVGEGVDYTVHLLADWHASDSETVDDAARRAAEDAGPAIATNALMLGAGFFVLTLGNAKPLQNVGALTATALVAAGLATFVAVPALARRKRYGPETNSDDHARPAS
ncbi:MAG TPA: MMPL family transporter, partial [Polyangiaceae bacterium]|nr:MMPL family transporter [Polyangiaceae bacterium]